jgi:hypothetical protein
VHSNSLIFLFFFLIIEIDILSAFNSVIRYSVLQYQRYAFNRAVTGLPTNFLSFPVTREVFKSKAECKA